MRARDVMTSDVATARPEMTVKDIASLMVARHISGLPVVSKDGEVVGMVSESDLLHRSEIGTADDESALAQLFTRADEVAQHYVKAHGKKVHDVMSRPVVSVDEDSELSHVADTLDRNRVKRVPVIRQGKVVGIISRSDLVRALSRVDVRESKVQLGSGLIHQTVTDAMRELSWIDTSYVNVTVKGGVVHLWGYVQSEDQRNALCALVEDMPGVDRIDDHLNIGTPRINWDGTIAEG